MKFRTRIAAITAAVAISAPAGVMLLATPAFAWHANSDCISNKWVVENPNEEWATNATFTFDDGTVMTPIEPGQEVAAPAAANHVTVTWVDYGTPHSYDRPEGCQPPVVYEDSASAEAICDEDEATLSVTVTLGGPADNVVVYDGQEHELGAKPAGTFTVTYPASVGSVPVIVTVVRDGIGKDVLDTTVTVEECVPAPTTTQPAPTTTQPAPTTTQPAPTTTAPATTVAPTTTQPAPVTTQPAPTTTMKPPTSTLPATGSAQTAGTALIALALFLLGSMLIMIVRRRPRLG